MNNMMIVVIVPFGYAEKVIQAANDVGVTSSTILRGRGATELGKENLLSLKIEPEEEIVLVMVPDDMVEIVCNQINGEFKNDSTSDGTLFVLPVICRTNE